GISLSLPALILVQSFWERRKIIVRPLDQPFILVHLHNTSRRLCNSGNTGASHGFRSVFHRKLDTLVSAVSVHSGRREPTADEGVLVTSELSIESMGVEAMFTSPPRHTNSTVDFTDCVSWEA